MKNNFAYVFFMLILIFYGCKKPYSPPAIAAPNNYLVVEGIINSGADSTFIKLSKTVNLSNNNISNPVTGATVTVEGDQNASYPLREIKPGTYASPGLNLDGTHKYRLNIQTGTEQYLSDYVAVLNSPPIDSVNFTVEPNGLNIYTNTHDPANLVKYYRWDYGETWMISSNYDSFFKSDGITIVPRDRVNDEISTCWSSDTSSTIILGTSEKISQDLIKDNPIIFIPSSSEKLGIKYSILVKQYALTGEAYTFWQNLKKNTEQLGSIFDPQPTEGGSNIHCVSDPREPVIGYLSVGDFATRRIFISAQQLPGWTATPAYPDCQLDTFLYQYAVPPSFKDTINQVSIYLIHNGGAPPYLPVYAIYVPGRSIPIGYTGSYPKCVDCTLRGTNKQPSFWK